MPPEHERAIEQLRARYERDPNVLGLIVIGSVARGDAGARSDVDCVLVVTTEEWRRLEARSALSFRADDVMPGGHVGGGIVELVFLLDAADRGPEPTRYAFSSARIVFTRDERIAEVLTRIPVYQERERAEKMKSFVSQLPVHLSYLELGEYSGNAWLLAETAVELVLFGGRLILAHNRILFPNRKQFIRALAAAAEKPDGIVDLAQDLMRAPSIARAKLFYDAVMGFRDWPVPTEGHWARFQIDRETNWRRGPTALADS